MTKLILIGALFVFFTSCQNTDCGTTTQAEEAAQGCTTPTEPEPPVTPPIETPTDPDPEVPNEAYIFDANIKFVNFEREDEEKVHKAIEIIKKVIQSSEFKAKVLNFTYNKKQSFVDNNGLTNAQVYQKLLDGAEDLKPAIDHTMDLELELYYSWRSTVGYTYPSGLRIWMNTKFFDYYTPSEVAGNIFHEWTHKLGFDHASSYSVSRDNSVPYALGYLIEELGKKYE